MGGDQHACSQKGSIFEDGAHYMRGREKTSGQGEGRIPVRGGRGASTYKTRMG